MRPGKSYPNPNPIIVVAQRYTTNNIIDPYIVNAYPIEVIVSRVEEEGEEDTELYRSDQRELFRKYASRRAASIDKLKRAVQWFQGVKKR